MEQAGSSVTGQKMTQHCKLRLGIGSDVEQRGHGARAASDARTIKQRLHIGCEADAIQIDRGSGAPDFYSIQDVRRRQCFSHFKATEDQRFRKQQGGIFLQLDRQRSLQ